MYVFAKILYTCEDAEQWREDLEAAGAAGRPGCAERAAREDDEVRGGWSFRRRQQWREDLEAAGAAGRPGSGERAAREDDEVRGG
jgi:hypothetical protein